MKLGDIANEGAQQYGKPLDGVRVLAAEQMQALPYATTCIQCQREAEKNGDVVGGGGLSRIFDGGMSDTEVSSADLEIDV